MNRTILDLWVGIFVVLGFLALGFLAIKVGSFSDVSSGKTYSVKASFDNIGGLKVRAPVKSAGVVVGRVGAISYDSAKHVANVRLDIGEDYKFSTDSRARILTAGLLGEQYIGLESDSEETMLADNGEIQNDRTQSAIVLETLISSFMFSNKASETPTPAPAQ